MSPASDQGAAARALAAQTRTRLQSIREAARAADTARRARERLQQGRAA